ncbi:MAG: hypothetical protein DBX55_00825 [Verrucomicrobia bacterium]|nr:MAG: hypothetical protein DBX55_00825 [Verrucomicrobiota bacterium]
MTKKAGECQARRPPMQEGRALRTRGRLKLRDFVCAAVLAIAVESRQTPHLRDSCLLDFRISRLVSAGRGGGCSVSRRRSGFLRALK